MNDLRPYMCTFLDCSQAGETYASQSGFLHHELSVHGGEGCDWENSNLSLHKKCVFCAEVLPEADLRKRGQQVGRHMEEIAFMVMNQSYEDWEFDSDATLSPQGPPCRDRVKQDCPNSPAGINERSHTDEPRTLAISADEASQYIAADLKNAVHRSREEMELIIKTSVLNLLAVSKILNSPCRGFVDKAEQLECCCCHKKKTQCDLMYVIALPF